MMIIKYTAFYAGMLAVFYVALSFRIIKLRLVHKVGIGHGESNTLHRAIRVHANFAEYVPLALLLLAFLELNKAEIWVLNILGTALLIGRLFHAMGLGKSAGTSIARTIGGILTYLMMLAAALLNILAVY